MGVGIKRLVGIVAGLALVCVAVGALPTHQAVAVTPYTATLVEAVAALPVEAEVRTGYDRTLFTHWVDADSDCQNTRAEVLIAESSTAVTFTSVSGCTVATGQWFSYYDGQTSTLASDFDIDHVVALAEAWDSGARNWTSDERRAYANDLGDPRALIAVTDNSNAAKSDADPTDWLPSFEVCRYITDWTAVKVRWGLSVDATEATTLATLAAGCPSITITVDVARGPGPPPPPTTTTTTTTTTTPPTTTTTPQVLQLKGLARTVSAQKYADLWWTGPGTRFDLWRNTTKLLSNTTVRTHADRLSKSTRTALYTVCPAGTSRTSPLCSSLTLTW